MPLVSANAKDLTDDLENAQNFWGCRRVARLAGSDTTLRIKALKKALGLATDVTECLDVHSNTPDGNYLRVEALKKALEFETKVPG